MSNTTVNKPARLHLAPPQVCKPGGWDMYPTIPYWEVDNVFSYVMPVTILQYSLFVILSQTMCQLFRPLKQIKFVSYALAGIMMGPSFIGRYLHSQIAPDDMITVRTHIGYVGMTFFVFIIGVKIDFGMIHRMGRRAWTIGTASLFVPLMTMVLMWILLLGSSNEYGLNLLLFTTIAISLATSGSANLASALDELELLTSDLGELSVSCSLTNDFIFGVCLLLQSVIRQPEPLHSMYIILSSCIILAFVVVVIRPIMLWIIERTPEGQPVGEGYIVAILLGVLATRVIIENAGGNALQGPLLFGFIIPAGPPLGAALTQRAETIISELLVPFYYMEIGAALNLRDINLLGGNSWTKFIGFEVVILTGFLAKIAATMWASLYADMSFVDSMKVSLFMNIKGITDLIIPQFYSMFRLISPEVTASLFVTIISQTIIITPLINIFSQSDKETDELDAYFARSVQTTSDDSELPILSCVHHEDDVPTIIALLQVSNRATTFPVSAYVIHMIELVGESASSLTLHQNHRRRCTHNGCYPIMSAFKNCSTNSDVRITVHPFTLIAPFKTMHEGICRLAQDRNVPLVLIPFVMKDDHGRKDGAFNSIISRLQASAPCTIVVLVDRGSPLGHRSIHRDGMTYRVGVFFIDGQDDREALAYASRMLSHPAVRVTLHQIEIGAETFDDEERRLNAASIDEFRSMSMSTPRAIFQRLEVDNWEHVLKVIRNASEDYDLVMVGRRQGTSSTIAQEMFSWTENQELGVIGDTIASLNHVDHHMTLLVIQHAGQVVTDPSMTISV